MEKMYEILQSLISLLKSVTLPSQDGPINSGFTELGFACGKA